MNNHHDYDEDDELYIEYLRVLNDLPEGTVSRIVDGQARLRAIRAERRREIALTVIALVAVTVFTAFLILACLDAGLVITLFNGAAGAVGRGFEAIAHIPVTVARWFS